MARKVKVTKRRVAAIVAVVFVVLAGAIGLHFVALGDVVRISDLVTVNSENTLFLRPKQWIARGSGVTTFADAKEQGKSTAVVGLQVAQTQLPASIMKSPTLMRNTALNLVTNQQVEGLFETGTGQVCTPGSTIKKAADTTSDRTTIGLYSLSASCTAKNNDNELHLRSVVGHDGIVRTLIFFAKHESWDRSHEAFQKILSSLRESDQPTPPPTQTL